MHDHRRWWPEDIGLLAIASLFPLVGLTFLVTEIIAQLQRGGC